MPIEALRRIAEEYPAAIEGEFAGHPLANFIRDDLPETFAAALPQHDRIIWHASPGQGRPAPDPIQPDLKDLSLEEIRRYRYHRRIERNSRLASEAKRIHGYRCQVCRFDFEERYGELGHEYIEAHHLTPLADLPIGRALRLSPRDDFAVVCANCHGMIHRKGAPESFRSFREKYSRHQSLDI